MVREVGELDRARVSARLRFEKWMVVNASNVIRQNGEHKLVAQLHQLKSAALTARAPFATRERHPT